MYFYNIGYYGYDSGEDWQLTHEREFTKDELAAQIHEAVIAVIPDECYIKGEPYIHSISVVIHLIAPWLIANKGFKWLEFTAGWRCESNDSMILPEDTNNEELLELSKALRAAGYTWRDDGRYRRKIAEGAMTEADVVKMWEEGTDAKE